MPICCSGRSYQRRPPLSGEARKRRNARHCARAAKRRGKIRPEPCAVCGSRLSEMHHPDYELPRTVVWLCRAHHLAWHAHFRALRAACIHALAQGEAVGAGAVCEPGG
jgi:hypothetical protein